MAPGATTISGSYKFTTTSLALAEVFVESIVSSLVSGAVVWSIPSANGTEFFIGITEMKN